MGKEILCVNHVGSEAVDACEHGWHEVVGAKWDREITFVRKRRIVPNISENNFFLSPTEIQRLMGHGISLIKGEFRKANLVNFLERNHYKGGNEACLKNAFAINSAIIHASLRGLVRQYVWEKISSRIWDNRGDKLQRNILKKQQTLFIYEIYNRSLETQRTLWIHKALVTKRKRRSYGLENQPLVVGKAEETQWEMRH